MNDELTVEHELLRKTVRQFVDNEIIPYIAKWDADGRDPGTESRYYRKENIFVNADGILQKRQNPLDNREKNEYYSMARALACVICFVKMQERRKTYADI